MKSLFIVGTPRSGTSYLARALSLPGRMAYLEESGMFSLFGARRFPVHTARAISDQPNHFPLFNYVARYTDALRGKHRLEDLLQNVWKCAKLQEHDLSPSPLLIHTQRITLTPDELSAVRAFRRDISGMQPPEIYRALADQFLELTGRDVFVEKTPYHMQYVHDLHLAFPEALVVCIVRNKKDAIASFMKNFQSPKKMGVIRTPDTWRLKQFIRECNRDALLEAWVSKQPYCHTVQFEDFIRNPYGQAVKVLDRLDLGETLHAFRPQFMGRDPGSYWDRLTPRQQEVVNLCLKDCAHE